MSNLFTYFTLHLERKESFKDLGVVIIDAKLTFSDHIHDKINKAYAMLGIIKRNFKYLTIDSFVILYTFLS